MYYEVHGGGEPVVLLHGAFMTITNNWAGWISELSKTRKVIAVEMQGHGRTADVRFGHLMPSTTPVSASPASRLHIADRQSGSGASW
jgi:pimeloyl-ACP methyl ester carboxylesterase